MDVDWQIKKDQNKLNFEPEKIKNDLKIWPPRGSQSKVCFYVIYLKLNYWQEHEREAMKYEITQKIQFGLDKNYLKSHL